MRFPVSSKMTKTITTVICLAVVLIVSAIGCGKKEDVVFPTALSELSLVQVWNTVTEITKVQEQTVELRWLSLSLTNKSTLDFLIFDFYGLNANGKTKYYQASVGPRGKLIWYSEDLDKTVSDISPNNPLIYFEELDKVGLATINPENISVEFRAGAFGYNNAYSNTIYQLEDGNLIPLKEIIFHTDTPFSAIEVYYNRTKTQTWFLTRDIGLAASVEYL